MSEAGQRPPFLKSTPRLLWSVLGQEDVQMARLHDVTAAGGRLATALPAAEGEVIRFDLLDDGGEKLATGLAEVGGLDGSRGMFITFLALGIDPAVVSVLAAAPQGPASIRPPTSGRAPPPMPGAPASGGRPPPLPPSSGRTPEVPPRSSQPPVLPAQPAPSQPLPVVVAKVSVDPFELIPDPFGDGSDPFAQEDELEEVGPLIEPLDIKRGFIIGIDLGTTNTCASYVVDGRPKIIPGRTGTNTIPSMITFDPDGTWHVGQRAADRQILYPLRTVYGSKRLVGRTFRPELAAELQQHFAYPLGEADGHRFGVRIDDRVISMDTIAARVLDEVRSTAEAHLGGRVDAAVITVPAYFTEVQREAVRRAAREANLIVHRIVNEPTAAAVAYGHNKQGPRSRVAVWDFGGGTFDFSIVDLSSGRFEVLTTGGDNFVGGTDFDDLLASHLLTEFQRIERINFDPNPQQIARVREAAEVAKRALSAQNDHRVELLDFSTSPRRNLSVPVTRAIFDELTRPLIDRTLAIARDVMNDVDLVPGDIDDVLLIGGTTRVPAVERAVAEFFQRRPSKRINPDEAVALGAALLADEISSASAPTLLDILPMSVGHAATGQRFVPIVARNSRLPSSREMLFNADLLGNVTIPLFQGEHDDVSRNEYLCTVIVEDRSLWDKGRVKLEISFDEHCVMAVNAVNARTGRPLPARLDRTRAVDEILRDLGAYSGPPSEEKPPAPPPSRLGQALGKLFKLFGR